MIGNESKVEVLEMQLGSLKSQVFILFGLLVLTLGGLTYCLFTLLSETTPDLIQASRIQVVDDDGFPLIDLYRQDFDRHSAGNVRINSSKVPVNLFGFPTERAFNGTHLVWLGADDELQVGIIAGESVVSGKKLWMLTSTGDGVGGALDLYNRTGDDVMTAYATRNGGQLHLQNRFNESVISMSPNANGGGELYLRDRSDLNKGRSSKSGDNVSVTLKLPDKPASGQ
jgi:hypothetical protein|tara:strand:+ start:103 stop:783 length:681 start_codon:yes stop_codon:yes gene_type:complete